MNQRSQKPEPIKDKAELTAALQLAVGLELSTIPVYLTALYSIKDGHNSDAAQTIRSVVMEEMLHMVLAANVLSALGTKPSTDPVTFKTFKDVPPVPEYPYDIKLISGIGSLELRPLAPAAVDGFVLIEHPFHGAAKLSDIDCSSGGYPTIGEFYGAIRTALKDHCKDEDFKHGNQVKATEYYGGAGEILHVSGVDTAVAAIDKIVDQGEGLPPEVLDKPAVVVTDHDRLNSGWEMYSHYARFRELQTGRRFRTDQLANEEPKGALLLVDYDAVHPAEFVKGNGALPSGLEGIALKEFDLAYTELVDDLYLAFSAVKKSVPYKMGTHAGVDEKDRLPLAVHSMWALKNKAVALMRTPDPARAHKTLCPRFHYARTTGDKDKLRKEINDMKGALK
ncbi:ferritin-like protein [Streptomyces sp. NPDC006458]|uniref:ferritin-like domain-containing protein n=1 Tax=Streptomyces sp. NPDC006458 TaxID=3154302 RepID=UPI00339F5317